MATIKVTNQANGESFEVNDISLTELTPRQLLDNFVQQGSIPRLSNGEEYKVTKGATPIDEDDYTKNLSEIGVKDGDEIGIVVKPTGA